MSNFIFQKIFDANSFLVNPSKKLGLLGLLNILQDSAVEHAEELGFGLEKMIERQTFWVLARQILKMNEWPKWRDKIEIHTWTRPIDGMYANRDFEIYSNGAKKGSACFSFMVVDGKTRRAVKPQFSDRELSARKDFNLDFVPSKLKHEFNHEKIKEFEVRNSDLDLNLHVNNIKYAQWILDAIPFEMHSKYFLKEYEINFLKETLLGDKVKLFDGRPIDQSHYFQGRRAKDDQPVFTARLEVES